MDYPSWAIIDLQKLDFSKKYNMDDFKAEMNSIDSRFVKDLSDDNWQATLGYLAVIQTEILSYENTFQ